MDLAWIIGISAATALLARLFLKWVSRRLNRRLAEKLARGPVGELIRFDYDYAMALSREVFAGGMSVEQAAQIADRHLKRAVGQRAETAFGGVLVHVQPLKGAVNDQNRN
jgi:hypothetical protein